MKKRTAELILKDPEKFAHHDRVFLNNPVVMQGMGLAPLVVVATTGQNGLMLAAAVALLLVVVGIVREWLSLGTVFGAPVGRWALLPLAKMPAGGFIVLGLLCAIWRAAAAKRKEYLQKEARDTLTVHYQKEADREP